MTLKDINGKEYEGTFGSVECNNFYSTDRYNQYGGYRHKPTGEVYILGYNSSWKVSGRVVWESASDTYKNEQDWVFDGTSYSKGEHDCLFYHIKQVDDDMDNWERINFKLVGKSSWRDEECPEAAAHWAINGSCIELSHRIVVPYEKEVHLTNGVVKSEKRNQTIHYPPPWPYPKAVLDLMKADEQTREAGGIREYEVASVGQLQEV